MKLSSSITICFSQCHHSETSGGKMTDDEPKAKAKAKSSPPLKIRIFTSILSAVTDFSRRQDGTVNRRLVSFLDPFTPADPTPDSRGVRSSDVHVDDPARDLWYRLFLPSSAASTSKKKLPLIVFFHGGGFAYLSAASRSYDAVCRRFARRLDAAVASVNYRRSPEHKYPAPYIDGLDVLRSIDSDPPADVDPSNCFLVGDSAGANIVHHVAKMYGSEGGWRRVRVRGLVLIQPWFGGEERTEAEVRMAGAPLVSMERTDWLWRAFLPEGEDRDHEAANVFGPRDKGELPEGFPKAAMVVVGGWDPLQDWQRRYAEGLRARIAGKGEVRLVEYEDAIHAFYVLPGVKEAGMLIQEIKDFMDTHLVN